MAKLTPDEQAALDALTAKAAAEDSDDDFEIEIYDGSKGARLPFSKGRTFLRDYLGFDIGDAPDGDAGKPGSNGSGKTPAKSGGKAAASAGTEGASDGESTDQGTASRYFGSNRK